MSVKERKRKRKCKYLVIKLFKCLKTQTKILPTLAPLTNVWLPFVRGHCRTGKRLSQGLEILDCPMKNSIS